MADPYKLYIRGQAFFGRLHLAIYRVAENMYCLYKQARVCHHHDIWAIGDRTA